MLRRAVRENFSWSFLRLTVPPVRVDRCSFALHTRTYGVWINQRFSPRIDSRNIQKQALFAPFSVLSSAHRRCSTVIEAEYIEKEVQLGDQADGADQARTRRAHEDQAALNHFSDTEYDEFILEPPELKKKKSKRTTIRPTSFPAGSETAKVWDMIDEHRRHNDVPPIDLYHKILRSYVNKGWINRSFLVLEEMQARGPPFDVTCFNIVCNYKLENEDFEQIPRLYEAVTQAGLELDRESYRILILQACETGDEESLEKWLQAIEENEIPYTMEIYKAYISFCKETNQPEKAFEFVEKMEQQPKPFVPDIEISNMMLGMYMENGKLVEAQKVIDLMDKYKIKANFLTYEITMYGYLATENYEEVDRMFFEMGDHFSYRSVVAHALLMKRYFLVDDVESAVGLFQRAVDNRMDLNTEIYTTLIEGLCDHQMIEEAQSYFSDMLNENIQVDMHVIEVLFQSFMKEQKFTEAENLIQLCQEMDIQFEPSTYRIIIDSCMENKMVEQALGWVAQVREIIPFYHPPLEFYEKCIQIGREQGFDYSISELMRRLGVSKHPLPKEQAQAKQQQNPEEYLTSL